MNLWAQVNTDGTTTGLNRVSSDLRVPYPPDFVVTDRKTGAGMTYDWATGAFTAPAPVATPMDDIFED